jgi:catechol 2,3-dioxygenase-like lactoylglutathione lyase family enzyme
MKQSLTHIAIIVDDYDKAIEFYTQKLHFDLIEDTQLSEEKRWVLVRPPRAKECSLLLAKYTNIEQKSRMGNQTGGRVFLFLHTDNFERDFQNLITQNIKIIRQPRTQTYGKVAVFEDLYGNYWDLIEPQKSEAPFYSTVILKNKRYFKN